MINEFLTSIKGELANQLAGKTELSAEKAGNASEVIAETFKNDLIRPKHFHLW